MQLKHTICVALLCKPNAYGGGHSLCKSRIRRSAGCRIPTQLGKSIVQPKTTALAKAKYGSHRMNFLLTLLNSGQSMYFAGL